MALSIKEVSVTIYIIDILRVAPLPIIAHNDYAFLFPAKKIYFEGKTTSSSNRYDLRLYPAFVSHNPLGAYDLID